MVVFWTSLCTFNLRPVSKGQLICLLKLVSAIFFEIFIFSSNDNPSKNYEKCFLFHLKSPFRSGDIQIFVIFSLLFQTFQIQKGKRKWNNLWCHELACINLQMFLNLFCNLKRLFTSSRPLLFLIIVSIESDWVRKRK